MRTFWLWSHIWLHRVISKNNNKRRHRVAPRIRLPSWCHVEMHVMMKCAAVYCARRIWCQRRRRHAVVLTNKYNISFLSGGICSEPPDILNGRHSVLGGTQQQLRYQCEAGYLLWGPSDLVCLANNTYVNAIIIWYVRFVHKQRMHYLDHSMLSGL